LPGGWADAGLTPAENVAREVLEESGFEVAPERLVAVWDRTRSGHPAQAFEAYKLFFLCRITGGAARTSAETTEVRFFGEDEIPDDLSLDRVLPWQVARMFAHARETLEVDVN
jgi:ADP-ribose pyrophosphatase YjhB (NUDIX family)